ncbi:uncharacterized protein LOC116931299 [Daphnia magna]|uniref:uncharacterized protein LOC116931299 n=1 Tax=Daphnia magna TaxID=35525 RepID=UPI001E1BA4B4|nr:uncharacterized protein LOC116931299 [Daphnia magna]
MVLNKKVKQIQVAVVPDIWVSRFCYYPNSKNALPLVMKRAPVTKTWTKYQATIKLTCEAYTEARAKLAETKSDFDTQVSQDDEASAVNKGGRPKGKRRPTNKNFGTDDSEDVESSDSDLEEHDNEEVEKEPAVPAGLCAVKDKSATWYVPPLSSTVPSKQGFTFPPVVNDMKISQPTAALVNHFDQPATTTPARQPYFTQEYLGSGDISMNNQPPASIYHRESSIRPSTVPPRFQQQLYPSADSWERKSETQQMQTSIVNETV